MGYLYYPFSTFHLLEHRVEFVPVNGRGLYEIFRQYMDVIGGFRQVLMTHVFPQEREHCHKVLSIVQPAVQAGRGELVAEALYPYFPRVLPINVRMRPGHVERGMDSFR